jgi:NADPH2:quinone reductase
MTGTKSLAAIVHAPGGPEAISLETIELGAPGPGEVLIRHTAIGVNFIDTYHRSGLYKVPLPVRLGVEAAGVVLAIGEGVTTLRVGDRVGYATAGSGAYAEARLAPADRLLKLPDAISDEVAAASLLKGMTAEYLIRRTHAVKKGETVLFHAAAGGVGLIASQWLAHLGATVIGTVGSKEKAELARAHGTTHAIDYEREDFVARVRELTGGRGVTVAYDGVGKTTFEKTLDCMAPRGLVVSFGNASGKPPPLDLLTLSAKGGLYVTRPTLQLYTPTRAELEASAAALFDVIASGVVKVEVRHRFPLSQVREAHRALESRATTGSVLLVP